MSDKPKVFACWTGTIYQVDLKYYIQARAMFDHDEEMPYLKSIECENIKECLVDIKRKIRAQGGAYLSAIFYSQGTTEC